MPDGPGVQAIDEVLLGGALRRFKPSEILCYLVMTRHAARAGRPVALTRDEPGVLTGLSRNTVTAALQKLLTHGLLRARTAPDSPTSGDEAVCPSAVEYGSLGPGGGEAGATLHLELAPVETFLQPEDRATFQSITRGFAPADHVAYREDALVWLRRHFPGRTPDEATIAAVRDRLLLLEHVGPSRLARYQSELDGFRRQVSSCSAPAWRPARPEVRIGPAWSRTAWPVGSPPSCVVRAGAHGSPTTAANESGEGVSDV